MGEDIYGNASGLCNTWGGDAFVYTEDESQAYSMWFFDSANNPNDAITSTLNASDPSLFAGYDANSCHLDYYHKATPSEEDDNFTECHPWKQSSCCYQETVSDVDAINQAYGAEDHWDRCGPLSQACERFFVQEACFYECSPNIGLFRKYHPNTFNSSNPDHNEWEVEGMPIKASYCNAWFDACRNDYFCGAGNFYECAAVYQEQDQATTIVREDKTDAGVTRHYRGMCGCSGSCGWIGLFDSTRTKGCTHVFAVGSGYLSRCHDDEQQSVSSWREIIFCDVIVVFVCVCQVK